MATDKAGRTAAATISQIKIDLTDPTVTCTGNPTFTLNQAGASVSASVSDALSGAAGATVSAPVSTLSAGAYTLSLTRRDLAGRQKTVLCPYTVGYTFAGFGAPVDSLPIVNMAKAGQTIPIKWHLQDANGNPISDPTTFASVTSGSAGCSATAPQDAIETYSGSSGLQYLGAGNWQYNWKTPTSYAGQCRLLTLNFADGSHHQASFQFK
jgi:hypothetical protein